MRRQPGPGDPVHTTAEGLATAIRRQLNPVPTDPTPDDLAERVLAAKPATPGPYRSERMPCQTEEHTYSHQVSCDKVPSGLFALLKRADSDFFALAANAAPILAAEVKRLTDRLAAADARAEAAEAELARRREDEGACGR